MNSSIVYVNGVDPGWVNALLRASKNKDRYIIHSSACNQRDKLSPNFCLNCLQLQCKYCLKGPDYPHKEHMVLPLYKASNEDGVPTSLVSTLIDISDIHPFVINHKEIVYISRRQCELSKTKNTNSAFQYKCEICGRKLQRNKRFCSIECKSDSGQSLSLKRKAQVPDLNGLSYRIKRRKGTPRRAPFF